MQDENKSEQTPSDSPDSVTNDWLQNLEFGPSWTRQDPGTVHGRYSERGDGGGMDARGRRSDRGGDQRRDTRGRRDVRREPARGGAAGGGARPAPPERARPPAPAPADRGDYGTRRPAPARSDWRPERIPLAPVEIALLPESKRLAAVAHRIRVARRAWSLAEVASLFSARPESCRVKIEAAPGVEDFALYQCKLCETVATSPDSILSHLLSAHAESLFEKEERVGEAPEGQFNCVARCGLSGVLLGPPNHHSYNAKVQEVHRSRFASMSLDAYRSRIEMMREPELIEKWKEESRHTIVYRRKGEAESKPLQWAEAEALFRDTIAPTLVTRSRRIMVPGPVALQIGDAPLRASIAMVWRPDGRPPRSLLFALRAALRHMHFHVFRWEGNSEFVTGVAPAVLSTEHVVAGIRLALEFVAAHPGCRRQDAIDALKSETPANETGAQLDWLVEKGHLIEFADGKLAVPRQPHPARPAEAPRAGPAAVAPPLAPPPPAADDASPAPAP